MKNQLTSRNAMAATRAVVGLYNTDLRQIRLAVSKNVYDWLEQLATYGMYGENAASVAEHFVRAGVTQQLREKGFLNQPPKKPTKKGVSKK